MEAKSQMAVITVRLPKDLTLAARETAARDSERLSVVIRRWLRQGRQSERAPAVAAETAA
jgi:hypothetical protein